MRVLSGLGGCPLRGGPSPSCSPSPRTCPLRAASIARVHRAHLAGGREVVVKVHRPGIREALRRDMHLPRRMLRGRRSAPAVPAPPADR
ncbi:MAG: hypothetical protein GWO39_14610 [Gammaproteobacteria bacterium]|nr:hypothetical protein [Gammaproteobacteria bacterium]NIT64937.1 hypothetical protein [Gammaproteobacteria bacterium]NIY33516.1 hypothetical protein [Gammaproteobacteria bacterium]